MPMPSSAPRSSTTATTGCGRRSSTSLPPASRCGHERGASNRAYLVLRAASEARGFVLIEDIGAALRVAYPELDTVEKAAAGQPVYLVGGAVRDLLLGRARGDINLVAEAGGAGLGGQVAAGGGEA